MEHDYVRIFKVLLSITSNAKLVQSGRHQSRTREVPGSILSVNIGVLAHPMINSVPVNIGHK